MGHVVKFHHSAAGFTGSREDRVQTYVGFTHRMNDQDFYEWLLQPDAPLGDPITNPTWPVGMYETDDPNGYKTNPNNQPVPSVYDGRVISELLIDLQMDGDTPERPDYFEVTATWSLESPDVVEEDAVKHFSMSLGVTSEKVARSLQTVSTHDGQTPGGAPNFNGWVNVRRDEDGIHYEGYQRNTPTLQFSVGYTVPALVFNDARRALLATYVGRINNAPFFGYPLGSVMFVGSSVETENTITFGTEYQNRVRTSLDLQFEYRQPIVNQAVPGVIGNINALGWDLLWFASAEQGAGRQPQVTGAYVERIYDSANLNDLIRNTAGGVWA